jgi:hypothetical protein
MPGGARRATGPGQHCRDGGAEADQTEMTRRRRYFGTADALDDPSPDRVSLPLSRNLSADSGSRAFQGQWWWSLRLKAPGPSTPRAVVMHKFSDKRLGCRKQTPMRKYTPSPAPLSPYNPASHLRRPIHRRRVIVPPPNRNDLCVLGPVLINPERPRTWQCPHYPRKPTSELALRTSASCT